MPISLKPHNIEAYKMLSIDRLKKLEKYYNDIIEQNNEKIMKVKKTILEMQ